MSSPFPLADNKVNATLQQDDHPDHHNALADAVNGFAVAMPKPADYGAVGLGDKSARGTISSGSRTLTITSGTNDFVAGQYIIVRGAGTSGADAHFPDLCTTIASVSGSTINLSLSGPAAATTITSPTEVYHDDTKAIQDCMDANDLTWLAPIDGGYSVNAQWRNVAIGGNYIALQMPSNHTLLGAGYAGRLVRVDTYRFGNAATYRFIVNKDVGSNYRLTNVHIDGQLSEVQGIWPRTTLTSDWNAIDNVGNTDTVIHGTSFASFPTNSSLSVVRPDGVPIQKPYTKSSSTTLTVTLGGGGTAYDTDGEAPGVNEKIPSGSSITVATRAQGYQCILFAGDVHDQLDGFHMDNVTIEEWPGTCLRPKNCTNFRISGCNFKNINRGPCELSDHNTYGTVENNTFNNCFDDTIAINGNVDAADDDQEAHHIAIVGNVLKQNTKANTYGYMGNTNIKVSGAYHVTVVGNTLDGGENTSSIMVWDSDSAEGQPPPYVPVHDVIVANNTIRNSSVNGIHVRSAAGYSILVTGNIIESPAWCGICVDPWTPDTQGPGNILYDVTVSNNLITDAGVDDRDFDSLSKHGIFLNNHGEANSIVRFECTNNKVLRAREHGFFSNVDGTDFHFEGNKFYDCGWLGGGDDVFSAGDGNVVRFSIKNTTIMNPNANLGAAKPRYGINIVNAPPAVWTEGYLSGLIAYNSSAHFSGTVAGTKPAYSDSGTGITTVVTTTNKTAA